MRTLFMTESAYQTMVDETRRRPRTETGGIMIGTIRDPILLRAGEPGPKAKLAASYFAADVQQDRQLLQEEMAHHKGRVKFLGYWHKQPGRMEEPSGADLAQARDLAGDAPPTERAPWYFIIANEPVSGEVKLYCYALTDLQGGFKPVALEIVSNDSKRIHKALEQEPPALVTEDINYWDDVGFQFYKTERGKERLIWEKRALEREGFRADVGRRKEDQRILFVAEKNGRRLTLLPPSEYPLNPPRVFVDKKELQNLETLTRWSSDCDLAGVAAEALEVGDVRDCNVPLTRQAKEAVQVNITIEVIKRETSQVHMAEKRSHSLRNVGRFMRTYLWRIL